MNRFQDSGHLIRVASVFLLGLAAFVVLRGAVIPKSYGRYGPYRGDALTTIKSKPLVYAGHEPCEGCHPDILEIKSKGAHAQVNCESCHGPQAEHADDPGTVKPVLPDVATLCVRCHTANIAKPSGFPQMDAKKIAQSARCDACHQPHSPKLHAGGKK